ncbi:hypothetical protein NBH20_08145 [Rhizobium sp. S153]|uniref:Alpha/beta hydrolase n=1 Tax=Ciceribacter sichuanensis TaxID=2949647 RepID=A0ABT0V662_9HYPH|nr:hypothetical protein [Ciceribacter sp. S153]MCM2401123.1 hypothetical protein [Ciceribacter sp. S153]
MNLAARGFGGAQQQAPAGRLVTVLRPSDTRNLIVCFNGYSLRAHARPDLPFETALAAYNWLHVFNANLVWAAEENTTWYLQHEETVISRLLKLIEERGISSVKFVGSSGGGYASIRAGLLLDKCLAERGLSTSIFSFAINPQTGFRPELIEQAREAVFRAGWPPRLLGSDPILLPDVYHKAHMHKLPDIRQIIPIYKPKNFAAILMYDSLNPIEQVFSGDILSAEWVLGFPQPLGLPHGVGCTRFWTEFLWEKFDRVAPFGKMSSDTLPEELRLLA